MKNVLIPFAAAALATFGLAGAFATSAQAAAPYRAQAPIVDVQRTAQASLFGATLVSSRNNLSRDQRNRRHGDRLHRLGAETFVERRIRRRALHDGFFDFDGRTRAERRALRRDGFNPFSEKLFGDSNFGRGQVGRKAFR